VDILQRLALQEKEKNFITDHVSVLLKSRASLDMLSFSLCNMKGLPIGLMNRPFFPTSLSIPSYDIGKWVGLRTYQHPLVYFSLYALIAWDGTFLFCVLYFYSVI
jgi:hypothetical protein